MAHINRGFLSGRLYSLRTNEYEGTKVANLSVRQYKKLKDGQEKVDFFPIEAWGPTAEYIERIFTKGMFASIEYVLKAKKDKETGHTVLACQVYSFDPQPAVREESHSESTAGEGEEDTPF